MESIGRMEVDKLLKLHKEVDRELARRTAKIIWSDLALLHKEPAQNGSLKGRKIKPKYRGPKGELWAGRGAKPRWLAALVKKGKKVESYRIKGA